MMKKIILSLGMALTCIIASAQQGDMSIGANLTYGFDANQLGLGPKFQYRLDEQWRGEASFNYFFEKNYTTAWDVNANVHYLFPLEYDLTIYPLVGLTYYHWSTDIDSHALGLLHDNLSTSSGKLGLNLGCGLEYPITHDFRATAELKYQYVNKADQLVLSVGLLWNIDF